jgi:hypothetical protein
VASSTAGSNHLKEWDERIGSLTQRILAVYEPADFNVLRQLSDESSAPGSPQTGFDPALRQAVTAVCDALILSLRLVEKIKHAKDLRAKAPILFPNANDAAIGAILNQPVVAVDPAELQDPSLFNLTARKYSIAEIYYLLDSQVTQAAAIFTEATRKLRDTQELLLAAEAETKQARARLVQAGLKDPQLDDLQTQIRIFCTKLAQDPLSELLRNKVQTGLIHFKAIAQEQIEAADRFSQVRESAVQLDEQLQEKNRQAQQIFADRLARVQVHTGAYPPLSDSIIKDLSGQLQPLLEPGDDYRKMTARLQDWVTTAKNALEKTEESLKKNQSYLDLRLELRGLLSALSAKAAALNQAEDKNISRLLNQAHTILYQRPSRIDLARELLSEAERGLNQVHPSQ